MANMTFKANLLPNADLGYNLGSSDLRWNIYGNLINTNIFQGYNRAYVGTSPNFDNPGFNGVFEIRNSSETTGETGTKPINGYYACLTAKTSDNVAMIQIAGATTPGYWIRGK